MASAYFSVMRFPYILFPTEEKKTTLVPAGTDAVEGCLIFTLTHNPPITQTITPTHYHLKYWHVTGRYRPRMTLAGTDARGD